MLLETRDGTPPVHDQIVSLTEPSVRRVAPSPAGVMNPVFLSCNSTKPEAGLCGVSYPKSLGNGKAFVTQFVSFSPCWFIRDPNAAT